MDVLRDTLYRLFGRRPDDELITIIQQPPAVLTIVATPSGKLLIHVAGTYSRELALQMLFAANQAILLGKTEGWVDPADVQNPTD